MKTRMKFTQNKEGLFGSGNNQIHFLIVTSGLPKENSRKFKSGEIEQYKDFTAVSNRLLGNFYTNKRAR